VKSQRVVQQNGSKRQTASQHEGSLQNGVERASRQSPAQLSPHPTSPQQTPRAMVTQPASQASVQQSGSIAHTPAQQTSSLQPGLSSRASKQLPSHGQFEFGSGRQSERAALTQLLLHAISQQRGSAAQTISQQVASPQPGVERADPQLPLVGQPPNVTQTVFAVFTHDSFQPMLQHTGLTAQTASQQASSLHPGVPWTVSGLPGAGQFVVLRSQAAMAVSAQVSSQARSQQVGSSLHTRLQHCSSSQAGMKLGTEHGRVRESPHVVKSEQTVEAMATQKTSHSTEQQTGSTSQTSSQQARSRHAGVSCGNKQLPALMSPQSVQMTWARVTQSASQRASQQLGSKAHTAAQHASSEQPGVERSLKQLPVALEQTRFTSGSADSAHSDWAPCTQVASQLTPQQNGSIEQTLSQQRKSLHPGRMWTARQDRFCPGTGVLLPHRHLGRLQMLSGAVARSAQGVSHAVVQQKGSMTQMASQQARSSQ
jgi:hypothetical protein